MSFFQNTCKPDGLGGKLMVKIMNSGHSALAQWGFAKLPAADGHEILDVGCGGGANVAAWLAKCPDAHVTGLDYSEVSVAETRRVNEAAVRSGRCEVVQGNAAALPFADGRFDHVSAFETIYFWPGLETCFAQVHRVLKPGGTFLICNECSGTNAADEKWTKIIDGMRIYDQKQICAALEAAGFTGMKCYEDTKKHWLCVLAQKSCGGEVQ